MASKKQTQKIGLYASSGFAEYTPKLSVIVDGEPLSDFYRSRIAESKLRFSRKKRPWGTLQLEFESLVTKYNDDYVNTADMLTIAFPLGAKVILEYGYASSFKTFGPFDVSAYDYDFVDGGLVAEINLQGFSISKSNASFRVYSEGSVVDVFIEACERSGFKRDKIQIPENFLDELYFENLNIDDPLSAVETYNLNQGLTVTKNAVRVNTLSPLVQTGESDAKFLYELALYYGLAPVVENDTIRFISLLDYDGDNHIELRYGDYNGNLKTLSFRAKSPTTSYIRTPTKHIPIQQNVPLQGALLTSAPETEADTCGPKPTPPSRPANKGHYAQRLYAQALEEYKKSLAEWNACKASSKTAVANAPSTQGGTSNKSTTHTKATKPKKQLGRVIGRKYNQGRVLSAECSLVAGTTIPYPGMKATLSCHSNYFAGDYTIDEVEHLISEEGYSTNLSLLKGLPKKLSRGGAKAKPTNTTQSAPSATASATATPTTTATTAPTATATATTTPAPGLSGIKKRVVPTYEQYVRRGGYADGPITKRNYNQLVWEAKAFNEQYEFDANGNATKKK